MIFLELVPHNMDQLQKDASWALSNFKTISGINIPDILRLNNRSYDAVKPLAKQNITTIPHIRICDFEMDALILLCKNLIDNGIHQVLLISGDPPPNPLQPVFDHNIIEVIKIITTSFPNLTIFAGHDPYRQSLKAEFDYTEKKLAAGAKGVFTQPIFDLNLAKLLLNLPISGEWFIGISPVFTKPSYDYWTTRNNVVFPNGFACTEEHNTAIAKDILNLCAEKNMHNYIMPIKADTKHYLNAIL